MPQDELNESDQTEDSADKEEIYVAEKVKNRQPYKCALLRLAKTSEAKARVTSYIYSFDFSKTDLIFNRLLKDERIQLHEGQTILPGEGRIKKKVLEINTAPKIESRSQKKVIDYERCPR